MSPNGSRPRQQHPARPAAVRGASVRGKFFFQDEEKLYLRGVTYGAFAPGPGGEEYHDLATIERDFALRAANGINTVRIPHTTPPRALLDVGYTDTYENLTILPGSPPELGPSRRPGLSVGRQIFVKANYLLRF